MSQKQQPQKPTPSAQKPPAPTHQKFTVRLNMFRLKPEERSRLADLYFGGMLAISVVILPNLLSQTTLDTFNFFALLCFVAALPALSGALMTKLAYKRLATSTAIIGLLGTLCAGIGIVLALWHISPIASATFFGSAIVTSYITEVFDPHSHW